VLFCSNLVGRRRAHLANIRVRFTSAVSEAQEIYEQTRADWETAVLKAKYAQERINIRHMNDRVLDPAERHEYVTHLAEITRADACWTAYEKARARYFRMLDQFAELEKPSLGRPARGKFEDPGDPYRNVNKDDGSLAWAMRQQERAAKDRKADRGPARGFNLGQP
jgi:hypothetical protein